MRLQDRLKLAAGMVGVAGIVVNLHGEVTYTDLFTVGTPAGFSSAYPRSSGSGQLVGTAYTPQQAGILWSAANPNGINLMPSGYSSSTMVATDGTYQVGNVGSSNVHAGLWSGTAASFVDLHPAGATSSYAQAVADGKQVGYANFQSGSHAFLWSGTAASGVDLHPGASYTRSVANSLGGGNQVGYGYAVSNGSSHALLWSGTANSVVDLSSGGLTYSNATATDGKQQVGYGSGTLTQSASHALLWTGTAASVVDLNPAGTTYSQALAVDSGHQVGVATIPKIDGTFGRSDAFLWSDSSESAFNLGSLLPNNFVSSIASSISGNRVYGLAVDTANKYHAIMWVIPEPAALAFIGVAGLALRRRRHGH